MVTVFGARVSAAVGRCWNCGIKIPTKHPSPNREHDSNVRHHVSLLLYDLPPGGNQDVLDSLLGSFHVGHLYIQSMV